MRRTRAASLAAVAALALLLAACGGKSEETAPQNQGGQAAPTTAQPATAAPELKLGQSSLGQVLTDDKGLTLYAFTPDQGGKSTCSGTCAQTWPPLLAQATPVGGDGVTASLLGTIARSDGGMQTTYKDWPLYHYAGDEQPGDVKGQGVGGKWFVVGADGTLVKKAGTSSGGGYGSGYGG